MNINNNNNKILQSIYKYKYNKQIQHEQIRTLCIPKDNNTSTATDTDSNNDSNQSKQLHQSNLNNIPSHLVPNILKHKNIDTNIGTNSTLGVDSNVDIDIDIDSDGTDIGTDIELQPYWKAMENRVIKRTLKPLREVLSEEDNIKFSRGKRNTTAWDAHDPYLNV